MNPTIRKDIAMRKVGNEHEIFRIDENDEEDSNARSYSFQFSEQNDDIND